MSEEIINLLELVTAGEWGKEQGTPQGIDTGVIRSANFTKEHRFNEKNIVIRSIDERKLRKKILLNGDILIEKSGGSPDQPVGRVLFYDLGGEYTCSNFISILRPSKRVDSKFLYYSLCNLYREGVVKNYQQQTTGIINLQLGDYLREKIHFPPLPEQKKIAEILSGIDKVKDCYIRKKKKIVLCLEGVLSEFFNDLKQNVPLIKISSFGDVITGSTPSTAEANYYGGNVPFISPADINDNVFIKKTNTKLTLDGKKKTRSIPEGSICVVCIGSTIGKVAISSINSATNQQINSILPGNYDMYYLYAAIKFFSKIIKEAASTHAVPIINKSKFCSLELPNPPIEIQQKIGESVRYFNLMIELLEKKIERLEKIKLALSSDLLSGRIRVLL